MKRKTLRKHKDFIMPRNNLSVSIDKIVYIRAKQTETPGDARYGVMAQKRLFKHAVQRNRAKRLLRDWIAFHEDLMSPELDYIFIANDGILDISRTDGRNGIKSGIMQINKSYGKTV